MIAGMQVMQASSYSRAAGLSAGQFVLLLCAHNAESKTPAREGWGHRLRRAHISSFKLCKHDELLPMGGHVGIEATTKGT